MTTTITQPDAWHVSGLEDLLYCGERYRRRRLERERRPPTTPQIRGTAVHRAVSDGLTVQQRTQDLAPVELFEDVAASEVVKLRHAGATLTEDEAAVGIAKTWGRLVDAAVRYARGYGQLVAPIVDPIAVERRLTVSGIVPGTLLRGTIDLLDASGAIIDHKTKERAPRSDDADRSQQLTMYDLLRTAETGDVAGIHPVILDFVILKPATGEVTHTRLSSTRGPRDRSAMVQRVGAAVTAVERGVFMPANPSTDWWCSARWCEFHADCPFALHGGTK